MNNDLEQFSEERLKEIADFTMAGAIEVVELARIALAAKQAKLVNCQKCGGIGMVDSGGTQPWGEPISVECDCITPQLPHTEHEVTLDYLHGHRDGLEWAARTAEACNPLTSDWLYEEREDLAAAIRNGPEMPSTHTEHDDTLRMDWLCAHCVEVRDPQMYGSHAMFHAQQDSEECDLPHHTTLREQIDAAMLAAAPKPESE